MAWRDSDVCRNVVFWADGRVVDDKEGLRIRRGMILGI